MTKRTDRQTKQLIFKQKVKPLERKTAIQIEIHVGISAVNQT